MTTDSVERVSRIVLWLSISATCLVAPVGYFRLQAATSSFAEKAKETEHGWEEEAKAKEEARKHRRMTLESMGHTLSGLTGNVGHAIFSNVSPKEGFVCVVGTATNRLTGGKVTSIAGCKDVGAYETAVDVPVIFPGANVDRTCPNSSCDLSVDDAPDEVESPPIPNRP